MRTKERRSIGQVMSENCNAYHAALATSHPLKARIGALVAAGVLTGLLVHPTAVLAVDEFVAPSPAPRAWLDRLTADDRAPLTGWIDFLPPAFEDDLHWIEAGEAAEAQPTGWSDWYDKVVVIQSWSNANEAAVKRVAEMAEVVNVFSEIDVQFIALHTPEGADNAEAFIRENDWPHLMAIDPTGDFCDLLGVYRTPVNIIIGRNGAVRYVGLSPEGTHDAVDNLLDEDASSAPCRGSRPLETDSDAARGAGTGDFPRPNPNPRANNLQGRRAPDFFVQSWANHAPDQIEGLVNVIKFWRTNCPHCINAIPKSDEMAQKYAGRVNFIGITQENIAAVERGLTQRGRPLNSIRHSIAIDTSGRMNQAVRPQGVPNAMIVDSDWVVRWQGHPANITEQLLDQILEADGSSSPGFVKRWEAEREGRPITPQRERSAPAADRQRTEQREPQRRPVERRRIEFGPAEFPPVTGDVGATSDLRGKPGPEFHVARWMSAQPLHIGGKVTVIEFFRTSCPHCRRAIDKLNDYNVQFAGMIDFITVSNENESVFSSGLEQHRLSMRSFNHFVALDPEMKMQRAISPRGVPHAIVLDSNWIVRWQGNPHSLTPEILEQIVQADAWQRRQRSS